MDPDSEQPTSEVAEPATPLYFGNYEVLKSIGRGKFAIVYRAKKIGDEQVVALKRIAVDMMNEKARDKCLKEVRLLQSLDHPNIIHYMDSFITENDLVIVYEWAAAGDLKRQLRKAQERGTGFEERVIWKYFSQICNAIKHMHDKRIMHRDLKPANIFLTLDGTIKVGDLGLSRELSEHTIQAHSKVGTPLYMSPEVLKNEGYDFKSDIWSLGCLLYELAMLKSPFKSEGLNLLSLFQKISNGDYQPLPEVFSEELRNLTYAMISTLPEDRPEIQQVCEKAQEMRTITAERAKSLRKSSNSNIAGSGATAKPDFTKTGTLLVDAEAKGDDEVDSRPNSGRSVASKNNRQHNHQQQEQQKQQERGGDVGGEGKGEYFDRRRAEQAPTGSATAITTTTTRASASAAANAPFQREGSFKLERVNEDTDSANASAKRTSSTTGTAAGNTAGGNSNPNATQPQQRNNSNSNSYRGGAGADAKDDFKEQQEDEEDEVTVGLGQADYLLGTQLRNNNNYTADNRNSKTGNNYYNNSNKNIHDDIVSASSEFQTPGVVALGSDNKPNYYRSGGGTDQSNYRSGGGTGGSSGISSTGGGNTSRDRGGDRGGYGGGNSGKTSAETATAGSERRFDASDFVSTEQTAPSNSSSKHSSGIVANNSVGASGGASAYRRAKSDARAAPAGGSGGPGNSNTTSTPSPSNSNRKTSSGGGSSSKANAIPRPSSNSSSNRSGTNQQQQQQQQGLQRGQEDGAREVEVIRSREGGRTNTNINDSTSSSRSGANRASAGRMAGMVGTGGTVEHTVQGRTLEQHLADSAPAFAVMDSLYTKLLLLRYPMEDPYIKSEYKSNNSCRGRLLPFHFACDLQIYPTVAGHSPGYQFMQFKRAIHIATWVCGAIIRGPSADVVSKMDVHQDTPIMCAKQLLRAAQAATVDNLMPAELVEVTPTQLMCGHGVALCTLLLHLCDAALRVQQFTPPLPVHEADNFAGMDGGAGGGKNGEEGTEDEDSMDDEAGLHSEGEEEGAHTVHMQMSVSVEDSSTNNNPHAKIVSNSILLGHIDPALWKQETERVASKLISARSRAVAAGNSEWADHIASLRTYSALNSNSSSSSTFSANGTAGVLKEHSERGVGRKDSVQAVALAVADELRRTRTEVEKTLNKITQLESVLNRQSAVTASTIQFAALKNELVEKSSRTASIQQNIAQLAQSAADLQERCDEINETLNLKTGGEGGGGASAGNTIVRLKDGLKVIKTEIKDMNMSITLLNNNLLELRKEGVQRGRDHYYQRRQRQQKQKAKGADNISVLSDDELID